MNDQPSRFGCLIVPLLAALLWAAIIGGWLWVSRWAHGSELPAPLAALADRIEADPAQPQWKRELVPRIRARTIGRFEARITVYCPDSLADPWGGGPNGAWSQKGTGRVHRLREGHCAVGTKTRAVPYGSVLYCPNVIDHLLIVVDCGPGVNGRDRLDVCFSDKTEFLAADKAHNDKTYPCWVLGHVSWEEAR